MDEIEHKPQCIQNQKGTFDGLFDQPKWLIDQSHQIKSKKMILRADTYEDSRKRSSRTLNSQIIVWRFHLVARSYPFNKNPSSFGLFASSPWSAKSIEMLMWSCSPTRRLWSERSNRVLRPRHPVQVQIKRASEEDWSSSLALSRKHTIQVRLQFPELLIRQRVEWVVEVWKRPNFIKSSGYRFWVQGKKGNFEKRSASVLAHQGPVGIN